jgi:hypothetical protein
LIRRTIDIPAAAAEAAIVLIVIGLVFVAAFPAGRSVIPEAIRTRLQSAARPHRRRPA